MWMNDFLRSNQERFVQMDSGPESRVGLRDVGVRMRVLGRLRIVDLLGGGHTWAGLCPRASRER